MTMIGDSGGWNWQHVGCGQRDNMERDHTGRPVFKGWHYGTVPWAPRSTQLSQEVRFLAQNAPITIWRPGSDWTRCGVGPAGELTALPILSSWI